MVSSKYRMIILNKVKSGDELLSFMTVSVLVKTQMMLLTDTLRLNVALSQC